MKSLIANIGKSLTSLRNDGVFYGGKKVLRSGLVYASMLRKVSPADILFVSGGPVGDSTLYRVFHQKEELNLHGLSCSVTSQESPWLETYADKFGVYIFHRVINEPRFKRFIQNLKREKKTIIYDTDDLVYDLKVVKNLGLKHWERKILGSGFGLKVVNDPFVSTCTTSTDYLANSLRNLGKKVFVVSNKLSLEDIKISETVKPKRTKSRIRIGYFSGSRNHDKDFASVTMALEKILISFLKVELVCAGPLNINKKFLSKFRKRIIKTPYVSRLEYFNNLAAVDINIAPLEIGNPFCEAKSELKFFEAGLVGVPTVAAATGTYKKAIKNGYDGFVASDTNEWFDKLSQLIRSKTLREKMGERARKKSYAKYTTQKSHTNNYYKYLKKAIKVS